MIYNNWLILGYLTGSWRAKKQSFPFTEIVGTSELDVKDKIDSLTECIKD